MQARRCGCTRSKTRRNVHWLIDDQNIETRRKAASLPIVLFSVDSKGVLTLADGRAFAQLGADPNPILEAASWCLIRQSPLLADQVSGQRLHFALDLFLRVPLTKIYGVRVNDQSGAPASDREYRPEEGEDPA